MALFPAVALNVSALFENYRWSASALAGLALVMLGNLLCSGARRRGRHIRRAEANGNLASNWLTR